MYLNNILKNTVLLSIVLTIIILFKNSNLILFIPISLYLFVLYLSFFINFKQFKIFQQLFVFLNIFWIIIRLITLLISSENFNYQHIIKLNDNDFAYTFIYLTFASFVFLLSLYTLTYFNKRKTNEFLKLDSISTRSYKFIIIYFIAIIFVQILIKKYFPVNKIFIIQLINIFTSLDVFIILFSFYFIYYRNQLNKKFLTISYLLFFLYVIFRLYVGSKSATYQLLLNFLVGFLLLSPKLFLRKKYLFYSLLLLPISVILFLVGTVFRFYNTYTINNSVDSTGTIDGLIETFYRTDFINTIPNFFNSLSARISMLDYSHVLINQTPINDYLGIVYALKTFLNVILPSFVSNALGIGDALVLQASLFQTAYGLKSYSEAVINYHSDMLPLFAYLYLNFGFMIALILIYLGFFIFFYCYNIKFNNNFNNFLFKGFFVIVFIDIMFGMGLVASFQQVIFFYVLPLLFYKFFKKIYIFISNLTIKIKT